jgi:hypothetical protein
MSTIIVKRWKDTKKLTRRGEYTLDGVSLEDLAKSIMDDIDKDRKTIVWAQVQIDARVIILEEIEG